MHSGMNRIDMKEFFIKTMKRRWLFLRVLPFIFICALVFFLLRGPYLSNSIKRVLIPILENATGERVVTDHAVINLLPFYLQVKSIRVLDRDGNRLLWITKTRAYIDIFALLQGEIRVRRLTLKEPNLTASKVDLQRMINHIQDYLSSEGDKRYTLTLKSIKLTGGEFDLRDMVKLEKLSGNGLVVNGLVKDGLFLDWSLKEGKLHLDGLSEMVYRMAGRIKVRRDGEIEVSNIDIDSSGSTLRANGKLHFTHDGGFNGGRLEGNAKIFVETINRLFNVKLEKGREGALKFSGSVDLKPKGRGDLPEFLFDLKTEGFFYLEDLMRLLKVKETINGRLSLDGRLRGIYPNLTGDGKARLENAVFSTLLLDDVVGEIGYSDKRFTLTNFIAHTYGGELRGDAYLLIPHGDYFVNANVNGIDSKGFFRFIRWDAPFLEGIINGRFDLKKIRGEDFDVVADMSYVNSDISEGSPIDRLKGFSGKIDFRNRIVGIKKARFFTSVSELFMNGEVDLVDKKLTLNLKLNSTDVSELLHDIRGNLRFTGRAEGPNDNPEISGVLQMADGDIKGFAFSNLTSDLTYALKSLKLKSLNMRQDKADYDITGTIFFKDAEKLFSFNSPLFDVSISMKNGDTGALMRTFYKDIPLSGAVDGTLSFKGNSDRYKGEWNLHIKKAKFFEQDLDMIDLEASFSEKGVDLHSLILKKDTSELRGGGNLYPDERFKISLTSTVLRLEDINLLQGYQASAIISDLRVDASGAFNNPNIDFSMTLHDGDVQGLQIKEGLLKGRMSNKVIHFNAVLLKDKVLVDGEVMIKKELEWNMDMDFKRGDYAMLLKGLLKNILKDVPEDLSLGLEGDVRLNGRGKKVLSMLSRFGFVNVSLYGYSFTNKEDILIGLDNGELEIKPLTLTGNQADVSVAGRMNVGNWYDLKMSGYLNIAPLKVFTDKISSARGNGSFAIDISGRWESPDITGEIDLNNISASVANFPYMIGPLNGKVFFKKDRVTLESLRGEIAGGRVEISGMGYLKGFSLRRIFITLTLNEVTLSHLEGIKAVFDGELFYDASKKGSILTGNINIKRAIYERRVEWKRWILGLRETGSEAIEQPTFLKDTTLNIHVLGSRNISVDNNILKAPVKIDLTIAGTVRRYGLIGSIETEGGSIYFRDNEFEIISGRVDFVESEEIRPLFNINAETFTSGYRIRLSLEGPVDKLTLSLFSDPPLSDNDILALLTAGRINKGEKGFESGIAAGEATAILTGGIQDVFEEKVKGIIGIERFEINPQTTSTGAVSTRVTVGKRLLNERLSVSYTTSIGTTEESIIRLKYRIGKNISLIGTRDELGSVGMDLNYRFEFK